MAGQPLISLDNVNGDGRPDAFVKYQNDHPASIFAYLAFCQTLTVEPVVPRLFANGKQHSASRATLFAG